MKYYKKLCIVLTCIEGVFLSILPTHAYWMNKVGGTYESIELTLEIGSWRTSRGIVATNIIDLDKTDKPSDYTFSYGDIFHWNNNYYSVISNGGGVTIENVKKPNAGEWATKYHGWVWQPGTIGVQGHVYAMNDMGGNLYYTKANKPNVSPDDPSAIYWAYDPYYEGLYQPGAKYKYAQPVRFNGNIYQVIDATLASKYEPAPETRAGSGWNLVSTYDWVTYNSYIVGDIVVMDQKVYRCVVSNTNKKPSVSPKEWELYVQR